MIEPGCLEAMKTQQLEMERQKKLDEMFNMMRSTSDFDRRCELRDKIRGFVLRIEDDNNENDP